MSDFVPPSATIAAVRAARPSLPGGSLCEPARNTTRSATSGLDGERKSVGRRAVGDALGVVGPSAATERNERSTAAASRIGAAQRTVRLARRHFLISVSRMMAVSLLGLKVLRRHALEVGRSETVVGGIQLVDRLRAARGRHGRADRIGDGVGRAQRAGERVAKMRLDRVQSSRIDRSLGGLGQGRGDP